jgi:hypothetical protein
LKFGTPASFMTTISPSSQPDSIPSNATSSASAGIFAVQSLPLRVSKRALPFSMRLKMRYPSSFASKIHAAPGGGFLTRVASCGLKVLGSSAGTADGSSNSGRSFDRLDRVTGDTRRFWGIVVGIRA